MKDRNLIRRGIFLAALCAIYLPLSETVAQVKNMSLQELTEESTAVLVGNCMGTQSTWNNQNNQIHSQITVQASQYVKGDLGTEPVITVPGGQVGDILYEVSDMPVFEEGEESLIFVWQHPSGKLLVTGANHGKLKIVKDKKTGEKTVQGGVLEFNPAARKEVRSLLPRKDRERVRLEDFIRTIKSYVN